MSTFYLTALVLYLALMGGIAWFISRRSLMKTGDDFVLAGRSLNAPVLAGTLLTTWVGGGTMIGGASFAFLYGPVASLVFYSGVFIGIITLLAIGRKVQHNGFRTVPELLLHRFGRPAHIASTIVITVAYIGILSYTFTGAGYIVSLILPIEPTLASIFSAIIIIALAMSGGLLSVAWTDAVSSVLIVVGLLTALIYVLAVDVGGFQAYVDGLDSALENIHGGLTPLQMMGYFLPYFLLITGDQNMHQRLAAAKSGSSAVLGIILFFAGSLLIIGPVVLLATTTSFLAPDMESDLAVLGLADDRLPAVIGALILVSAFAILVTTGSSYVVSAVSNVVYDLIYLKDIDKANEPKGLLVSRAVAVVVSALSFVLVQFFPTVLEIQMYTYTMYGAALTPVIFAALFWKRATPTAAVATIVVGGLATIAWEIWGGADVNSVIVSLPAALLTLVALSYLSPPSSQVGPVRVDEISHTKISP